MKTEKIVISLRHGHWHITSNDPRLFDLFGTDTIPTPFNHNVPLEKVMKELKDKNPHAEISHAY